MEKLNPELAYCIACGKENSPDKEICDCGSRSFVFGKDFTYTDKKVVCNCGSDTFGMTTHINMSPIHNKIYKCSECGNTIGVQTYCDIAYDDSESD